MVMLMGAPTVGEELVASDGRQLCGCTRGYKNNKSPTSPYILISYGGRKVKRSRCTTILAFSEHFLGATIFQGRRAFLPRKPGLGAPTLSKTILTAHNLNREKSRSSRSGDKNALN